MSKKLTVLEIAKVLCVLAPIGAKDRLVYWTHITFPEECNGTGSDSLNRLRASIDLFYVNAW
jgi:hypothetical protein